MTLSSFTNWQRAALPVARDYSSVARDFMKGLYEGAGA